MLVTDLHTGSQLAHHRGSRGNLLDTFTLHTQTNQEAPDLCRGGLASHDLAHDCGHLIAAQVCSVYHRLYRLLDIHVSLS